MNDIVGRKDKMFNKDMLEIGCIIKDSDGEYGIILEFGTTKFISYKDGVTPFECIDNNLIWTNIKHYLAIDHVYKLDDYIPLYDLNNLKTLDKAKKLVCVWSRN